MTRLEHAELPGYAIGDRVLCCAVEKAGTITVLWPNGAAYVRCDDGEVVACGLEVLVPEQRS